MKQAGTTATLAAAVAVSLLTASGAGAQGCGLVGGVALEAAAGAAHFGAGDGITGAGYGADVAGRLTVPEAAVRLGYRRVALDGPDVDAGRLTAAVDLPFLSRWTPDLDVCATIHGGASHLGLEDDAVSVVAGGAGLRVSRSLPLGRGALTPYAELRGLGAVSTGSVLGLDVGGRGLAVGGEGGIRARLGRMTVGLSISVDGLDDGLGLTPFPTAAAGLTAGLVF